MNKMILGYATKRGLRQMTREDAQRLTHINLAFGTIDKGLLSMRGLPNLHQDLSRILAFNPALRIVLSIGGWTAGGFSIMSRTEEGRRAFAESVRKVMDEYALDGVDIDWEYPCNDAAGIDCDPSDRENFTHLLQALRDAAGERIVSIAAGGGEYFIHDTEMDKVAKILDYVQIMTYDLGTGKPVTGHHTPLHAHQAGEKNNAEYCVELFKSAGVPAEKLLIGAGFYSRIWHHVQSDGDGFLCPADDVAGFGPEFGQLTPDFIRNNGYQRYWDDAAQAPWLFNGSTFLTFDDERSVAAKSRFVLENNLAGLMYWEHSCDPSGVLLKTIHEILA